MGSKGSLNPLSYVENMCISVAFLRIRSIAFIRFLELSLTRMCRDVCKRVDFLIGMGKCTKRKDLEKNRKENKTINIKNSLPLSSLCVCTHVHAHTHTHIHNLHIYMLFCRLAFFELNYQFHTTSELQSEVIRHYSKQVCLRLFYKVTVI